MSKRVYNFSAGPAALPEPVLRKVQEELLCLPGAGASILEISHRSGPFTQIIESAESRLRRLLGITDEYAVLFLQGGSRLQFSMVPMNLLGRGQIADYVLTGSWGKQALKEAQRIGETHVAWDGSPSNYDRLPADGDLDLDPQAAYVHFTSNETIEGVQFANEPAVGATPLVCDASSDFLYRPLEISKYGLLYACAQKNAGPAGLTIVIVRKDLLKRADANLPGYLNYETHADKHSLWNTPPTFAIYVLDLVAQWLEEEVGGLDEMFRINRQKADLLYKVLDESDGFYRGHARIDCRSTMNVTFRLPDEEITSNFVSAAKQRGLDALKGHRSVGGIRASIYNAVPLAGVEALREFMVGFRHEHAKA
ncbi:MAG: 3-phosphoserine/phosphohydroxythreonine transaminase [Planctomycetota bacterium]